MQANVSERHTDAFFTVDIDSMLLNKCSVNLPVHTVSYHRTSHIKVTLTIILALYGREWRAVPLLVESDYHLMARVLQVACLQCDIQEDWLSYCRQMEAANMSTALPLVFLNTCLCALDSVDRLYFFNASCAMNCSELCAISSPLLQITLWFPVWGSAILL